MIVSPTMSTSCRWWLVHGGQAGNTEILSRRNLADEFQYFLPDPTNIFHHSHCVDGFAFEPEFHAVNLNDQSQSLLANSESSKIFLAAKFSFNLPELNTNSINLSCYNRGTHDGQLHDTRTDFYGRCNRPRGSSVP